MFNMYNRALPASLNQIVTHNRLIHEHNTRNIDNPHVTKRRTKLAPKSLRHMGPVIWYQIPISIKKSKSIKSFINKYMKHIFHGYS